MGTHSVEMAAESSGTSSPSSSTQTLSSSTSDASLAHPVFQVIFASPSTSQANTSSLFSYFQAAYGSTAEPEESTQLLSSSVLSTSASSAINSTAGTCTLY